MKKVSQKNLVWLNCCLMAATNYNIYSAISVYYALTQVLNSPHPPATATAIATATATATLQWKWGFLYFKSTFS